MSLADMIGPPPSAEEAFRSASLRYFLRFYQVLRPEVVAELRSRVYPLFLKVMGPHFGGQQASQQELETYRETFWSWIDDFGLPKSADMVSEASLTLFPPLSGRPGFFWDSVQFFETQKIPKLSVDYSYPFTFQASGWTPAKESIEEAVSRLKSDFEKALSNHAETCRRRQSIGANLQALLTRHKGHLRNIRWLAYIQTGLLSRLEITKRPDKCSMDTVRRGLHSAADCLGLPRENIRRSRPGPRPGRPRQI